MTTFTKSLRSNKTGECSRLATHIATAASAMGLVANVDASRQSASHYVYVASAVEADEQVKIRCSDHDDKHGGSDWYVWAGECPSRIIARLADHFGMMVPMGYRPEDYAARSDIAKAAAATRSQARRATESDMIAAVIDSLSTAKGVSAVAAGKVIDALYPAIPRAQRQRIAYAASSVVVRDRAITAAAGDETALAELARYHDEAKVALFELVGAERFISLRPSAYPRSFWKV